MQEIESVFSEKLKILIDQFLDHKLTIIEKLSGTSFYVSTVNGKYQFSREKHGQAINRIDQTLNIFWKEPISIIESVDNSILPNNYTLKFEWFFVDNSLVKYERRPKRGLILTAVWDNKNNLCSLDEIEGFNKIFGIESVPLIFDGFLTSEQKQLVNRFLSTKSESLVRDFGTNSFIKYLLEITSPKFKGILNDKSYNVEGVIIKSDDKDIKDLILVDPIVYEVGKTKEAKKPKTIYSIILVDMLHWILESGVIYDSYVKGETSDARYIELIISLWKKFISENGDKYLGLDFEFPEELSGQEFRLNQSMINDPLSLQLINSHIEYEYLLQIFLAAFRKKKKKPIGILTDTLLEEFNSIVQKIQLLISEVNENLFPSYLEFIGNTLTEDEEIEIVMMPKNDIQEFITDELEEGSKKPAIIYNGIIPSLKLVNEIKNVFANTGKKISLFSTNTSISIELQDLINMDFFNEYSEFLESYTYENTDLPIQKFIADEGIDYLYVNEIDVDWYRTCTSLEVISIDLDDTQLNISLIESNYNTFKSLVPECISHHWLILAIEKCFKR